MSAAQVPCHWASELECELARHGGLFRRGFLEPAFPRPMEPMNSTPARLVLLLAATGAAHAQTTWYVDASAPGPGDGSPGNPYRHIQYAIEQPTTLSHDVLLCAPGTYEERVDYLGKSLAIRSSGGSAVTTILVPPPPAETRAVAVRNGEGDGTLLEGFTLTGDGSVPAQDWGVGVQLVGSVLELRDVVIDAVGDEQSGLFVGLYATNATLTASDCVIRNNKAFSYFAPAMGLEGGVVATFARCTFADNYGFQGSGAWVQGSTVEFADCIFRNNWSQNEVAGALYADQAVLTLRGCELSFNRTLEGYRGGAIFATASGLVIEDCLFEGNEADRGGALFVTASTSGTIRGSTFVANVATQDFGYGIGNGGAIYAESPLAVERCVFVGNQALGDYTQTEGRGGAIYAPANVLHCSFDGNFAAQEGSALFSSGTVTDSIVWGLPEPIDGGATVTWSDVEGGYSGTGNIDQDPLFVDAAAGDLRLRTGSPCIDAGDPAGPPDEDGSRADMGALPYGPAIESYCTAKVNSLGCSPAMTSFGTPTLASGPDDFVLAATDAINRQFALLIWGYAEGDQPLFGGTLCVGGGFVRSPVVKTGGSPTGMDCTGSPRFPFTQAYMAAHGIQPYDTLYSQWWSRDPGFPPPANVSLSDGLRFSVLP